MTTLRKLVCIASAAALAASFAPAAYGDDKPPPPPPPCQKDCPPPPDTDKSKCNAGNGNGSDAITFVEGEHCFGGDPGNSYNAGNRGGDEIPTSGGVPNPGGNNVP
jgi:hypothetical protein